MLSPPRCIPMLLCLCLSMVAGAAPVFQEGDEVLVVGDGFAEELAARGVLEHIIQSADPDLHVTFHHRGLGGTEVADLPRSDDVASLEPDVIIVCVGMVDAIRGDGHLRRFTHALVEFTRAWPNQRVLLVTPIPTEPSANHLERSHALAVGRFADAVHEAAGRTEAISIDLHGPLRRAAVNGQPALTYDGMHLSNSAWGLAQEELAWQLGLAGNDPRLEVIPVHGREEGSTDQSMEFALRIEPGSMPELATREDPIEAPAPVGLTWDDAMATVKSVDSGSKISIEALRAAMGRLVSEPERGEAARRVLLPLANPDRNEAVRLAALAALDDLPVEHRPDESIQTIRMHAVPVKMVYDVNRFDVVAGLPVRIVLDNPDAQPHNLLVLKPGSLRAIGREVDVLGATKEAKARHWVPDSPRILHVMPMVDPGGSGELRFIAPSRPGRYPFVCTYPGHWRMMNGVMTVRPGPED